MMQVINVLPKSIYLWAKNMFTKLKGNASLLQAPSSGQGTPAVASPMTQQPKQFLTLESLMKRCPRTLSEHAASLPASRKKDYRVSTLPETLGKHLI